MVARRDYQSEMWFINFRMTEVYIFDFLYVFIIFSKGLWVALFCIT